MRGNTLNFDVYDDDVGGRNEMGRYQLDLIEVLDNPHKWNAVECKLAPFSLKDQKSALDLGTIYIEYLFTPGLCYEGIEGLREPEPQIEGTLHVKVVDAQGLQKIDLIYSDKPTIEFFLSHD